MSLLAGVAALVVGALTGIIDRFGFGRRFSVLNSAFWTTFFVIWALLIWVVPKII